MLHRDTAYSVYSRDVLIYLMLLSVWPLFFLDINSFTAVSFVTDKCTKCNLDYLLLTVYWCSLLWLCLNIKKFIRSYYYLYRAVVKC